MWAGEIYLSFANTLVGPIVLIGFRIPRAARAALIVGTVFGREIRDYIRRVDRAAEKKLLQTRARALNMSLMTELLTNPKVSRAIRGGVADELAEMAAPTVAKALEGRIAIIKDLGGPLTKMSPDERKLRAIGIVEKIVMHKDATFKATGNKAEIRLPLGLGIDSKGSIVSVPRFDRGLPIGQVDFTAQHFIDGLGVEYVGGEFNRLLDPSIRPICLRGAEAVRWPPGERGLAAARACLLVCDSCGAISGPTMRRQGTVSSPRRVACGHFRGRDDMGRRPQLQIATGCSRSRSRP